MYLALFLFRLAVPLITCGLALALGDRPAKLAGGACLAAVFATLVVQDYHEFYRPQYAIAAVDMALLAAMIVLAMIYRRTWLLAAGAFMMLVVATHIAFIVDLRIGANIRATAANVWANLTLVSVAWGGWSSWRDRRSAAAHPVIDPPATP
jgi:hypothetical protein